jgi:hypothetical protein
VKYKPLQLVICTLLAIGIALIGVHYSYHETDQQITEYPACFGGSYIIPTPTDGNLCIANRPARVITRNIRQKDNLEYYGFAAAGALVIIGYWRIFKHR